MSKSGLEMYERSLLARIEATQSLIEQTNWWISAQEDYGVTDIEGEEALRAELALLRDNLARDNGYLKIVRTRLANS